MSNYKRCRKVTLCGGHDIPCVPLTMYVVPSAQCQAPRPGTVRDAQAAGGHTSQVNPAIPWASMWAATSGATSSFHDGSPSQMLRRTSSLE